VKVRSQSEDIIKHPHPNNATTSPTQFPGVTENKCMWLHFQTLENTEKQGRHPGSSEIGNSKGNVHPFSIGSFVQKVSEFP
jgi:hypothetical protein